MTRSAARAAAVPRSTRRSVVTVGVFDGVHRAHRQVIRWTISLARRLRATSIAVTFDPDPAFVLHPAGAPDALMPLDERLTQLRQLGLDRVVVIRFTKAFAQMGAQRFIDEILVGRLRAVAVVVGEAFLFGRHRAGTVELLSRQAPRHPLRVVPMPPVTQGGEPVSSSRIRRLIAGGALAHARQLLGRPPALYGRVVRGAGRGKRLGFPTANVRLMPQVLPPQGVYAVTLRVRGIDAEHAGVMNFGIRPTFGGGPAVCEVHLPGFTGTLLGCRVVISLRARLRGERCFTSPDALVRQIRRDVRRARRLAPARL